MDIKKAARRMSGGCGKERAAEDMFILLIQFVGLDLTDSGTVRASYNRGIFAWTERHQNCRLAIIGRRNSGALDRRRVRRVFPVVVRGEQRAVGVVQLHDRVLQWAGNVVRRQLRPEAAQQNISWV